MGIDLEGGEWATPEPAGRLVLVGGGAGNGKSTLARRLAALLDGAWLQIDTIWIAMAGARDDGRPGIDALLRQEGVPMEELVAEHERESRRVCRGLREALKFELESHPTLVADGAWLLPEFVAGLRLDRTRISAVFLHGAEEDAVRAAMDSRRAGREQPWHARSARVAWVYGNHVAAEARRLGLPVVASRPFETLPYRVGAALGLTELMGPGGRP